MSSRRALTRSAPAMAGLAAAALLAGCGGSADAEGTAAGGTTVTVRLTDGGCAPEPASIPAGPATFRITNDGAGKVSEAELMRNGRIVGEKENLTPGLSGSFSLDLEPGDYEMYCPGARTPRSPFTVTAASAGAAAPASADPALTTAATGYHAYVVDQVDRLVAATTTFAAAVKAGDAARAKALYAPTRVFYERVEPVAESFGDLDPRIDARVNDVADPNEWSGFHRIEKALWADGSLTGMGPVADALLADVRELKAKVATVEFQPAQLANGATELLDEVGKSKVTGEEERYSHTDLYDFAANVDGAQEAVQLLMPTLQARDPQLASTLRSRFAAMDAALARYRTPDGGYVDYSTVADAARRSLAQQVDALAEPLSTVAAVVVQRS